MKAALPSDTLEFLSAVCALLAPLSKEKRACIHVDANAWELPESILPWMPENWAQLPVHTKYENVFFQYFMELSRIGLDTEFISRTHWTHHLGRTEEMWREWWEKGGGE